MLGIQQRRPARQREYSDQFGARHGRWITDATAVAVGGEQTCVLRNIGTVQCWGEGTTDNGGENSYVPVTVSGITNAIAIAVGDADCALLSGGTVQCWGDNSIGELGNNDLPMDSAVPVTVSGITNAVAVAAGGADNCALLNDGTVQCWGQNNDGQVGNGTRTGDSVGVEGDIAVPVPVSVIGLTNAVSVAVDGEDACALLSDGTVQCWGGNDHGELGNGTATNLPIPSIERTPPLPTSLPCPSRSGHHQCHRYYSRRLRVTE